MTQNSPSLALQLSVPSEICHPDEELLRAKIPQLQAPTFPGQSGIAIVGHLGQFVFIRNGRYWMVYGAVPLNVAEDLFRHEIGQTDVRVVDLTLNPVPPITAVIYRDSDGKRLVAACLAGVFGLRDEDYHPPAYTRIVINPEAEGRPYVEHFFITSEQGLQLFVNTLRKYNLV